jgi:DNA-binding CsgD family transcriptional regulator
MESVISPELRTTQVLQDHVASVYRYAVDKGAINAVQTVATDLVLGVPDVKVAIEYLIEYRLLREENHAGHRLVPVDPEIATASLISPMEREIYQRREQIARIQERIDPLRGDYAWGCPSASRFASIEHVAGSMEVAGYLKLAGDACDEEVMALRSGRKDAEELDEFLRFCPDLVKRGIVVRVICEHRSRADFTSRMKIKHLMDEGALVRTASLVPRAAIVFDQSSAVLLGFADGETSASRVRNGHVMQFLLDVFSDLWDSATPVESFESGYAEVADDLQLTIAGLMAKGFTDEVLARKLGMSVRTCRRHIAAMMHDLDAVSRFQAGARAASHSLLREA